MPAVLGHAVFGLAMKAIILLEHTLLVTVLWTNHISRIIVTECIPILKVCVLCRGHYI